MVRTAISLGSNIEPRREYIEAAIAFLCGLDVGEDFRVSEIIETAPVECAPGTTHFLNAVAILDTTLAPLALLDTLQSYERKHGRPTAHGLNMPRTIDLDILTYGDCKIATQRLTIPHPRLAQRGFFKILLDSLKLQ